jgi:hypothetical protein
VVVSAPSYAHGVVDPVAEVAALGLERGVPVHTDACIGGWTLPYLARLGVPVPPFDLSVPGVCSISVDLHKYGYAPKGTSLLLFKDADYRLGTFFTYSSWPGYPVVNTTMQSTKSAGPPAAAWAVLRRIGDAGFERLVGDAGRPRCDRGCREEIPASGFSARRPRWRSLPTVDPAAAGLIRSCWRPNDGAWVVHPGPTRCLRHAGMPT